jgi:hypothetical protein
MNEEERKLLERAVALGEENQKIIKKIRSHQRAGIWFKVLYILVMIGFLGVGYIYIKPYIQEAQGMYQTVMELRKNVQDMEQKAGDIPGIQNILNMFMPGDSKTSQ